MLVELLGRDAELTDLLPMARGGPLVTVVGPAGVGKSRFATEVATRLAGEFADGVRVVSVDAMSGADQLAAAFVHVAGLDPGEASSVQVCASLAERELLLLLDGCEHLIAECGAWLQALLPAAPKLRVLATSRQALDLWQERKYPLEPMDLPDVGAQGSSLSEAPSVQVFAYYAAMADPAFRLDDRSAADVAELCRRLSGLPLALQLAASRAGSFTVSQLLDRLDGWGALRRATAAPAHHQSLNDALAWSFRLCTAEERLLWSRLSVFVGPFTLAMVAEVCGDERLLPSDLLRDALDGLVRRSVLQDHGNGSYRLLAVLREYGATHLARSEEATASRLARRSWALRMAGAAQAGWRSGQQVEWVRRMTDHWDELESVVEESLLDPEGGEGVLTLLTDLWFLWVAGGRMREGRHFLEAALAVEREPTPARARALWVCAWLALLQDDLTAAHTLLPEMDQAMEGPADDADRAYACYVHGALATLAYDTDVATEHLRDALELMPEEAPFGPGADMIRLTSAAARSRTKPEVARRAALAIQKSCRRRSDGWNATWGDYVLAIVDLMSGEVDSAEKHARAALKVRQEYGDPYGMAVVAHVLSGIMAARPGQEQLAAELEGAASALRKEHGMSLRATRYYWKEHQQTVDRLFATLGDARYEQSYQAGAGQCIDRLLGDPLVE
ncbi:ATP-binding protein [Streptomyces sp. NBC_01304]|uniref:ATP-binding protein n=1 Tax=Streptomyces sp. NBC_01304 TaxID=2903818 RepID=UPI002E1358EC|nr:hypothetical protein OG430_42435 [Streptomyces sp. NBC_01304]